MAKKKNKGLEVIEVIKPLITFQNFVITPGMTQPVKIETEEQKEFLDKCVKSHSEIFIGTSEPIEGSVDDILVKEIGVVAQIDRILQMPGAPSLAFVKPLNRARFLGTVFSPSYPMAKLEILPNIVSPEEIPDDVQIMLEKVNFLVQEGLQFLSEPEKLSAEQVIEENSETIVNHLYAISHVSPLLWTGKYRILECNTFAELALNLCLLLDEAQQKLTLQKRVHEKTHVELSQQQKEAFLRQHLKNVREELGESEDDDIEELLNRADKKIWSEPTQKHFEKELRKLQRLNINNPEYSVQYAYLDNFLELPWLNYNQKPISLNKVQKVLDRDHFGLENVKERILEYMAVVKLRKDLKAPILCLYGPPGVGKTSIGKSVAEATGREYARISLGGMHDEAEIRGHRRTYIGAMPGRFLHSLSKLKYGNPLMLLDEIDKVGKDFKGDPSSALLEALDPEQNHTFHDNFIDYPYDLSRVLFIATANDISTIPPALKDRMELIELPGYKLEEKREIALRHLISKALTDNGFKEKEVKFTTKALDTIITSFTKEKGVRQLNLAINRVIRKLALKKAKNEEFPHTITPDMVKKFLDKKDIYINSVGFRP